MAENTQQALDELLNRLRRNNAQSVADEIARVVARGTTEEIEIKGAAKELSQRPLDPDEAFRVAVEMLVASIEPIVMKNHAMKVIEENMDTVTSIEWRQDFVEKSPIAPEGYEEISIPDSEGVEDLEKDLKKLVKLMGEA